MADPREKLLATIAAMTELLHDGAWTPDEARRDLDMCIRSAKVTRSMFGKQEVR